MLETKQWLYEHNDLPCQKRVGINISFISQHLSQIQKYLNYRNHTYSVIMWNNYLPKCWKVLFSKPRFIKIFFSSSEVRASAEIVRDESRFGNRTFKHFGEVNFLPRHFIRFSVCIKLCLITRIILLFHNTK